MRSQSVIGDKNEHKSRSLTCISIHGSRGLVVVSLDHRLRQREIQFNVAISGTARDIAYTLRVCIDDR